MAFSVNYYYHFNIPASDFFIRLDSLWYLHIVANGYDYRPEVAMGNHASYVFFPLLPLLIKTFTLLTGLPAWVSGLIISNLLFILSLYLFYRLLAETMNSEIARLGVFLLCFNPYAVYFTAIYTESLFLALSLGFWLVGKHRSWFWLGVLGFLMSLTHPNGVLMIVFALWFVIEDYRKSHGNLLQYWPVGLIPLGVLMYMLYLYLHTGDPLAFIHNEVYWSGRTGWPIHGFMKDLKSRLYGEQYNLLIFIVGLGLSLVLVFFRFYKEALLIPLLVAPAVLSGSFISLARYSATLFSFYLALSLIIYKLELHRSIFFYGLFLLLMGLATCMFITFWFQNAYLVY